MTIQEIGLCSTLWLKDFGYIYESPIVSERKKRKKEAEDKIRLAIDFAASGSHGMIFSILNGVHQLRYYWPILKKLGFKISEHCENKLHREQGVYLLYKKVNSQVLTDKERNNLLNAKNLVFKLRKSERETKIDGLICPQYSIGLCHQPEYNDLFKIYKKHRRPLSRINLVDKRLDKLLKKKEIGAKLGK